MLKLERNNMWKSTIKPSVIRDQSGVVSLFVSMIIMIIMSIVVIGFSQISRREVRSALDRELSAQAFYAAESGINDAYSIANAAVGTQSGPASALGSCNNPSYVNANSNVINYASQTSYTCLLVDVQPSYLTFQSAAGQPSVADLVAAGTPAPNFNTLNIEWENDGSDGTSVDNVGSGCSSRYAVPVNTNSFLPSTDWSPATTTCPPVLQIDIVPVSWAGGGEKESTLAGAVKTFFLKPTNGGGTDKWNNIKNGQVEAASCNTTCNFNLKGMAASGRYNEYFIKMMSIYGQPPAITLSGTDTTNSTILFKNSQLQIDSTGKSEDVLRRIKVVLPIKPGPVLTPPVYAIQTNSTLCKRLEVGNNGIGDFGYVGIPTPVAATKGSGLASNAPADIIGAPPTGLINSGTYNLDLNAGTNPSSPYNFTTGNQASNNPCDPY